MSEGTYALSKADENRENERLKNLEAASHAFTIRHLEEVGATAGWRMSRNWRGRRIDCLMAGSLRRTERVSDRNGR